MPTNLAIDDSLLKKAQRISRNKTKKATVNEALVEYIQRREQKNIAKLFGTIEYYEDYTPKQHRRK